MRIGDDKYFEWDADVKEEMYKNFVLFWKQKLKEYDLPEKFCIDIDDETYALDKYRGRFDELIGRIGWNVECGFRDNSNETYSLSREGAFIESIGDYCITKYPLHEIAVRCYRSFYELCRNVIRKNCDKDILQKYIMAWEKLAEATGRGFFPELFEVLEVALVNKAEFDMEAVYALKSLAVKQHLVHYSDEGEKCIKLLKSIISKIERLPMDEVTRGLKVYALSCLSSFYFYYYSVELRRIQSKHYGKNCIKYAMACCELMCGDISSIMPLNYEDLSDVDRDIILCNLIMLGKLKEDTEDSLTYYEAALKICKDDSIFRQMHKIVICKAINDSYYADIETQAKIIRNNLPNIGIQQLDELNYGTILCICKYFLEIVRFRDDQEMLDNIYNWAFQVSQRLQGKYRVDFADDLFSAWGSYLLRNERMEEFKNIYELGTSAWLENNEETNKYVYAGFCYLNPVGIRVIDYKKYSEAINMDEISDWKKDILRSDLPATFFFDRCDYSAVSGFRNLYPEVNFDSAEMRKCAEFVLENYKKGIDLLLKEYNKEPNLGVREVIADRYLLLCNYLSYLCRLDGDGAFTSELAGEISTVLEKALQIYIELFENTKSVKYLDKAIPLVSYIHETPSKTMKRTNILIRILNYALSVYDNNQDYESEYFLARVYERMAEIAFGIIDQKEYIERQKAKRSELENLDKRELDKYERKETVAILKEIDKSIAETEIVEDIPNAISYISRFGDISKKLYEKQKNRENAIRMVQAGILQARLFHDDDSLLCDAIDMSAALDGYPWDYDIRDCMHYIISFCLKMESKCLQEGNLEEARRFRNIVAAYNEKEIIYSFCLYGDNRFYVEKIFLEYEDFPWIGNAVEMAKVHKIIEKTELHFGINSILDYGHFSWSHSEINKYKRLLEYVSECTADRK